MFHPYVKENSHIFKSGNTAFSVASSDSALGEGYNRKNSSSRVTVVKQEAIRNATNGTFFFNVYISLVISPWNECNFSLSRKIGAEDKILTQFPSRTISPCKTCDNFTKNLV